MLDNLEQLTAGTVGILGELLAACPGVRMLVTSREPLRLAGEQQYEVPGARTLRTRSSCSPPAPGAVAPGAGHRPRGCRAHVCERLDRLPLAIELAAARTKVLSPADILDAARAPPAGACQRAARRAAAPAHAAGDDRLELRTCSTADEQRLLARLSVFAGGCTLQAAEAVCDAELDTLEGLVDRSLVRADGGRYRMLQTLREYALDKLARSGQEDHIRRRHAQWCIELIEPYGLYTYTGPEPGRVRLSLAVQERENFRAALEWARREGEIETVARVAAPLTPAWTEQGRLSEAGRWLGVARERSTRVSAVTTGGGAVSGARARV